jgi:hypothetical protein
MGIHGFPLKGYLIAKDGSAIQISLKRDDQLSSNYGISEDGQGYVRIALSDSELYKQIILNNLDGSFIVNSISNLLLIRISFEVDMLDDSLFPFYINKQTETELNESNSLDNYSYLFEKKLQTTIIYPIEFAFNHSLVSYSGFFDETDSLGFGIVNFQYVDLEHKRASGYITGIAIDDVNVRKANQINLYRYGRLIANGTVRSSDTIVPRCGSLILTSSPD